MTQPVTSRASSSNLRPIRMPPNCLDLEFLDGGDGGDAAGLSQPDPWVLPGSFRTAVAVADPLPFTAGGGGGQVTGRTRGCCADRSNFEYGGQRRGDPAH